MDNNYRMCNRCIMDTRTVDIIFDENGVCNFCKEYDEIYKKIILPIDEREIQLSQIIDKIKKDGENKEYDCLIGVSGGVDSTYLALKVKEYGLRPLAVHLDNGWNSELAVNNIEKMVKRLDIDLYTHVINWKEFRDLQLSFLNASVANCEIPTDHAIVAANYKLAEKHGIKYYLSGQNFITEGILPFSYGYYSMDLKHIKAIHNQFGKMKLRSYPTMSLFQFFLYSTYKKIHKVYLLNLLDYKKDEAKTIIKRELDWIDYGSKHSESIYTRFFQGYILPRKFNIDKRYAHLSTLICSGEITRDEAMLEMSKDIYTDENLRNDKEFVLKKLELSEEQFEKIMNLPIKKFSDYPNNYWLIKKLLAIFHFIKR